MQWPSIVPTLVLVLAQFTWTMLAALAMRAILLAAHVALLSDVTMVTQMMLE